MKKLEEYIKSWDIEKEYTIEEDCVRFALGAYQIVTGKNIEKRIGKYSSAEEWLSNNNYVAVEDAVTDIVGKSPQKAIEAKYGDIVSLKYEGETSVGVCKGARAYFVQKGKTKLIKIPLRMCDYSWSVK